MVVLAVHPLLARRVRAREHGVDRVLEARARELGVWLGRLLGRQVVHRGAVGEELRRRVDDRLPLAVLAGERTDVVALRDLADDRAAEVEAVRYLTDGVDVAGRDLVTHALLGLREQNLEGVHVRLALVDGVEVDAGAEPALGDHLGGGAAEARSTEVAGREDEVAVDQRLAGLDEQLLGVGVADLDRRPVLGLGVLGEVLAGEARAAEAVPAGRVPDEHQLVPRLLRGGGDEAVLGEAAHAGDVHERVPLVALVELRRAGDRRDADGVPVVPDALHDAIEEVPGVLAVEAPEVQGVSERDGVRPHRQGVPDDAADPGRGAVVGVDVARVVVALHAERQQLVGSRDANDGGVVARPDDHVLALAVERGQQRARRAVRAVFAPEVLEQRGLRRRRVAAEFVRDQFSVRVGEWHSSSWFSPGRLVVSMRTFVAIRRVGSVPRRFSPHLCNLGACCRSNSTRTPSSPTTAGTPSRCCWSRRRRWGSTRSR